MKINIKATGIELTPALSDYIYKKLGMIEKYLGDTSRVVAQVEVAKVTEHHKLGEIFRADVHLTGGVDIYTAEETEDIYASIDKVKDEIIRQLSTSKSKQVTLARKGEQIMKSALRGFSWGLEKIKFKKFKKDK